MARVSITRDQQFPAYLAEPGGDPIGGIVVIQEIFGVNAGIRRKCDSWSEKGYLAVAPDLFWRSAKGVELDPDVPEQFSQALDLMGKLDQDQAVADIQAAIEYLRRQMPESYKVGVVGYCLGGRLAFMAAARTNSDASVGYHGVGIDGLLDEQGAITKPLMLHMAVEDHFVPKDAQARIHAGLEGHAQVTLHDYPGVDHGFASEMGKRRSEEAARLADERTERFFAEHLG
jgi:carboxymethylenebutenolidase